MSLTEKFTKSELGEKEFLELENKSFSKKRLERIGFEYSTKDESAKLYVFRNKGNDKYVHFVKGIRKYKLLLSHIKFLYKGDKDSWTKLLGC